MIWESLAHAYLRHQRAQRKPGTLVLADAAREVNIRVLLETGGGTRLQEGFLSWIGIT